MMDCLASLQTSSDKGEMFPIIFAPIAILAASSTTIALFNAISIFAPTDKAHVLP
jgi:hypothetical protein